jgi:RNA polymerase sigma-70 factor (ECF subfamily)
MFMINDERALNGLKELDRQVIGEVYDQYFSEVYRYAYYRVGDATLAEDISSDVFLRLVESSQTSKGPQSNLRGWLIATASHIVADQFRKKYRGTEEALSDELPDQRPLPAAEVDQREKKRAVQTAYKTLTPDQQEVIALRFGRGYSLEETAAMMNNNVNAVKALQFRALSALSREIGEVDHE